MDNNLEIPIIETPKIKVYIKLDSNKVVKEVGSSNFIQDLKDWIYIDEGYGDKYGQAQGSYLVKGLVDEKGRYNYKFDTALVELTEEEKNILFPIAPPQPSETEKLREELNLVQQALDFIVINGGI